MINLLSKFYSLSKENRCYIINSLLALSVLFSMILMFFVQFKVEELKNKVSKSDAEILDLDDEIRILEVEWVYLTRPERLRNLSEKYLENNGYIASNQVKDPSILQVYYNTRLEKQQDIAMN